MTEVATEHSVTQASHCCQSILVRTHITVTQNFKMTFDFLNIMRGKILVLQLVTYSTIILPATTAFGMGKVCP
jgi:hypothetical protein